jgi:hypothetical protein
MTDQDGRPLAVCINDCEIDYGQPGTDLAKVCFRLGCAFAEMRWGNCFEKTVAVNEKTRPVELIPGQSRDLLAESW